MQVYLDSPNFKYNPPGVDVVRANKVPVGDGRRGRSTEVVDILTIYKYIIDFRDAELKYSAKLLPDGSGIEIFEPICSHLFAHNVEAMHDIEGRAMCPATKLSHQIQATEILQAASSCDQVKTSILLFPPGITCTDEFSFFGNGGLGDIAMPTIRRIGTITGQKNSRGQVSTSDVTYMFVKVAIAGTRAVVTHEKETIDMDDVTRRMENMGPVA